MKSLPLRILCTFLLLAPLWASSIFAQSAWTPVPINITGLGIDRAALSLQVHSISPAPDADTTVLWASILGAPNRVFLRSTNGGSSWKADTVAIAPANKQIPLNVATITNIVALSSRSAIIGITEASFLYPLDSSTTRILRTTDAGQTWQTIDSIYTNGLLMGVAVKDNQKYYAVFEGMSSKTNIRPTSFIRSTLNGGSAWSVTNLRNPDDSSSYAFQLGCVYYSELNHALIIPVSDVNRRGLTTTRSARILEVALFSDGSVGATFNDRDLEIPTTAGPAILALSLNAPTHYAVDVNPSQGAGAGRIYRRYSQPNEPWIPITSDHFFTGHLENRSAIASLPDEPQTIIVTANPGASSDYKQGCAITRNGGTVWTSIDSTTTFANYALLFANKRNGWAGGYSRTESEPLYIYKWNADFLSSVSEEEKLLTTASPIVDTKQNTLKVCFAPSAPEKHLVLRIYTTDGKLVETRHIESAAYQAEVVFDIQNLAAGAYFLSMECGTWRRAQSFVKE